MSGSIWYRAGSALVAIAFLSFVPRLASAQVRFNLPAEPLAQALKELAIQADLNIYFDPSAVAGLKADALQADLTPKAAFARLLAGTRLVAVYVDEDTVRVVSKDSAQGLRKGGTNAARAMVGGAAGQTSPSGPRTDRAGNIHRAGLQGDPSNDNDRTKKSHEAKIEEVVITGSRLRTTSKEGPQEVQIYDREQIEQSGENSVSDFLTTLPSVSLASASTAFQVGATVTLRGLPEGTTLVLLDGRRIESSGLSNWVGGGDFFDLNDIPLAAVQRVEVSENGSSAVYGSDAIAGVVNIILKKDFNGFAANAKYGWAKDRGVVRTNLVLGRQWHRGGFSVIASYGIDGGLLNSDRLLSASNDYRSFGGPDNNFPVCSPGNVFSTDGAPLPGAPVGSGATYAAVTGPIASGRPAFAQFTYGALNECSFLSGASLLPETHRAGVLVNGHFGITPAIALFTEVMYTRVSQLVRSGYQSLFGLPGFQSFTVGASNPYNPFGITVGVAESLHDAPSSQDIDTDFFRPLVGLKGTIARRWQWEISAWQSADWTQDVLPNLVPDYGAIQNALNSSDPVTALNPFVNGPIAPQSVLRSLFTNGNIKWMGRDRSVEAFMRGPIFRLPTGDIRAVIGGDYVKSTLHINDINDGVDAPNTRLNYQRKYYAVFGEARIPLIGRHSKSRHGSILALTIAGRHDQYSQVGGDTTDQVGLELRPADGLLVRGTYAESFKAPPLPSLYNPQTETEGLVTDPLTGAPAIVQLLSGGNPDLRPLTGRSHAIGVVYSSRAIPGLLLSATQWRVVEDDAIQDVPAQVIVDNSDTFPGRVIRDSSGAIVEVNDTAINFGTIDVSGLDYLFDYQHSIARGKLSITLNATETYHYRQALVPGAPPIEVANKAQDDGDWAPRWKGTLGLGWKEGSVTAHVDGRYTSSYQDYDSTRRIGKFWILDVNLRWRYGEWLDLESHWFRRAYLEAGTTNLLNRAPEFSNYLSDFYGYDAAQMSIVGRSLYVQTGVHW